MPPPNAAAQPAPFASLSFIPMFFVVLWSTGFLGAKLGLPHAGPLTFLTLRFGCVLAIMVPVTFILRSPWPKSWREVGHIAVSGFLNQTFYLIGVFAGISLGVGAGVTALIIGLQPVVTAAIVGRLLGEKVTGLQWLGLILGLIGLALVVWNKIEIDTSHLLGMGCIVIALISITLGTVYQKRFCSGMDLCSGTVVQNIGSISVGLIGALALEHWRVTWTGEFVFALGWLVLVLSVVSMMLFYWLLKRGAASQVVSLFYLVPPVTALLAWIIFGETFGITAILGMALAAAGVALANRGEAA